MALASAPALAFDAGGVTLGAAESAVKQRFPNAYCKPLEWESKAADRRCDDGRIEFAGVRARITFYLKGDAVEAFDVRFRPEDAQRVVAALKKIWGTPDTERHEIIPRRSEEPRSVYKVSWTRGRADAALEAERAAQRASLLVSRGRFASEIYEVR